MWPRDFDAWLPHALRAAFHGTHNRLSAYAVLVPDGQTPRMLFPRLTSAALRHALALAQQHRSRPQYLANHREFSRWLASTAYREALRLLPEEAHVQDLLKDLPPDVRRTLLWLYADLDDPADLARLRQTTPSRAVQEALEGYRTLVAALPRTSATEATAFPVPPALVGHAV